MEGRKRSRPENETEGQANAGTNGGYGWGGTGERADGGNGGGKSNLDSAFHVDKYDISELKKQYVPQMNSGHYNQ